MSYDSFSGLNLGNDYMSDNYLINRGYVYKNMQKTSTDSIKKYFYKEVENDIGHKYTIFVEKDIYESSEEYAENYYFSARFRTKNIHQFFEVNTISYSLPSAEDFFEKIWKIHDCDYLNQRIQI